MSAQQPMNKKQKRLTTVEFGFVFAIFQILQTLPIFIGIIVNTFVQTNQGEIFNTPFLLSFNILIIIGNMISQIYKQRPKKMLSEQKIMEVSNGKL
ncbi:hypothetical protein OF377_00570 [Ureaplasma sp. ES3154-GEN]|uniref:hypothetical protein n=1 Tax=Ureaplasma sp. ES3154-GEN TaxID=2984844 RepID=UPI0021E6E5B7|nr:hypothetical protein [Ureaplasma sp. ES3154-GEN]MCV3743380.1 hypothetical protein [Ureaplasma sp. ES3154-GEN]